MKLLQLHWQFADGTTEVRAQREISGGHEEIREWVREVSENHPLPKGAIWMICDEESEHFVWTTKEAP